MARKKKHPEHVNHERWLVSYADFITLLFAFFVVMFAVSQVDAKKVGRFSESFSRAIGIELFSASGRDIISATSGGNLITDPEPTKGTPLPDALADLQLALAQPDNADEDLQGVKVIARRNELVLRLADNLL